MKLTHIISELGLDIKSCNNFLDREVLGGYVSDMLSDVMANADKDDIWVTLQIHLNIVPVASMKEIAAIIIANGRYPDGETLEKSLAEKIPILGSKMNSFQIAGKLYQLGINGENEQL
jgi:hypothetical protein